MRSQAYRRIWSPVFDGFGRLLVLSTVLTTVASMLEAGVLLGIALFAQSVADESPVITLGFGPVDLDLRRSYAGVALVGLLIVSGAIQLLTIWLRAFMQSDFARRIRERIMTRFFTTDVLDAKTYGTGRLQEVTTSTTGATAGGLSSLAQIARSGASLTVLLVVALLLQPLVFLGAVGVGAGLSAALRPISRRVRGYAEIVKAKNYILAEELAQSGKFLEEIRVFAVANAFERRINSALHPAIRARRRASFSAGAFPIAYQVIGLSVLVLFISVATAATDADLSSIGAAALLMLRSVSYGQQLQGAVQAFNQAVPSIRSLEEELARLEDPSRQVIRGERALDRIESVVGRSLSYRYGQEHDEALRGVDIELLAGRVYGLAGPSGSGKSTLIRVLLGLGQPTHGDVLVNGQPIWEYSSDATGRAIAYVPQQPALLEASLSDNVRFFRNHVTDADIERAIRLAGLDDVIAMLGGVDAPVGPRQRDLSVGQVQRVGIARALAGAATFIVLDEPTSALDPKSEDVINSTLKTLAQEGAVVLVVAHRPTTLVATDQIIVLRNGLLEAVGPPTSDRIRATVGLLSS